MPSKKTPAQLRNDIARVFYNTSRARYHYGLEEAITTIEKLKTEPPKIDECFGGALRGGLYKHDLIATVKAAFEDADRVLAAMREQPDAALELLTSKE